MAVATKKLSQNQLTAALVTQYTVPASTNTRISELLLCNTDTVMRTVTVHFVPSGGAADATNIYLDAIELAAGQTLPIKLDTTLNAGDFIRAMANLTAVVNLLISGSELT